ncbi:MAG: response regulator [Prolixibacteraceae bacterium]|jgi:signal transduction histidine kinase/ligand-binding sensor domain-containing protein/DNA-binding response OmpR family regulator|nr:response regulator [Prolixibacteraceae bacterium]
MHKQSHILYLLFALLLSNFSGAINIERFEKLDTRDGLSQNNVLSMYCDHNDFLWFGTMDGLNRFDGYSFKIFKTGTSKQNGLTHNRISKIWEDGNNVLWVETYDGYYHYYIREIEAFQSFPEYSESIKEHKSIINSYSEYKPGSVWIGSTGSGIYHLTFNPGADSYYDVTKINTENSEVTTNTINFFQHDNNNITWVGTESGLFAIDENDSIETFLEGATFRRGELVDNRLYTHSGGNAIDVFDVNRRIVIQTLQLIDEGVFQPTFINQIKKQWLIVGTESNGFFVVDLINNKKKHYVQNGMYIERFFTDSDDNVWLKTEQYGITKIDLNSGESKHYDLIEKERQTIIDDERPYFYEDQDKNLWIGTHGGGLALYNRGKDKFTFYRNNPQDKTTLSSDFVHCIAEDKSGLLWLGTGQFNGGANKVITANPSFKHIQPKTPIEDLADNVVRSVFQDSRSNIWIATKNGSIYVYDKNFKPLKKLENIHLIRKDVPGYNIYAIMEDRDGHIWLGSKGGGVLVSERSIKKSDNFYEELSFLQYRNEPNNEQSLSNNNVYSIIQDHKGNIWIGTYGGGLNFVLSRNHSELTCKRFTISNSTLSSNDVRYLHQDSRNNLWIATAFGLNVLSKENFESPADHFRSFLYDPDKPGSISYNDVIHIFEDSKKQLWFGTFGGGVSILENYNINNPVFKVYKTNDGLPNDAVFSILEDNSGKIWMSTENGISSYLPARMVFENYDSNSGIYANNYCENACCKLSSGQLVFGNIKGALLVNPEFIEKTYYAPRIAITNFQLNNRDIDIHSPESPIKNNISTLEHINLKYNQSSFSFEYSALSYLAPNQNFYAFMLEGFEEEWNFVGNQRKATYTNLSPGAYTFMVRAANWDGTWNEIPRKISIVITPPWWKSTWALIIYFIVSLFLVEIARRIFMKYYRMQNDLRVERRVNDIKLQFFTNISHEIRTPLTLILGPIADIKEHNKLPAEVKSRIEIMERNGKRMLKLINQLLDFRKIQNKKMDLKVVPLSLNTFVDEICEQFTPIARHKNINFKVELPNIDIGVYADPNKFDSVIFNILSNAFKYTGSGKSIKVKIDAPDNDYVDIDITDKGNGIPKNKINYLFQRFTPLSESNNNLAGTGIGLSLAYEIMQLHKGDIIVDSKVGEGSTFTIRLPLGKAHFDDAQLYEKIEGEQEHLNPDPITETSEPIVFEKPDSKKPVVLVVEDNTEVLLYISDCLNDLFKVETAIDGRDGLEKIKSIHPDLIITDVMMPEVNGIEFTKEVKNDFEHSHIPVIMLTAKSNVADQIEGVESGAEAYILKPFNSQYLRAVSQNFIKQRELVIRKYRDNEIGVHYDAKITSKDDEFLQQIFKIIEENFTNSDFNVEQLIDKSAYSRTVLYNKVKGMLGVSPVDLIRQVRLKHAARLITEGGHKISEAAYASGFNDPKYFRKCFKKMYSISPTEYKNENT